MRRQCLRFGEWGFVEGAIWVRGWGSHRGGGGEVRRGVGMFASPPPRLHRPANGSLNPPFLAEPVICLTKSLLCITTVAKRCITQEKNKNSQRLLRAAYQPSRPLRKRRTSGIPTQLRNLQTSLLPLRM